jgi:DNA (cytosine-5)-methyltransferase 1
LAVKPPIASDDETVRSVAHSAFTVGSLFSGVGGIDLGFAWAGFETRWFCEVDDYCRRVLAKHWPGVPCYGDIRTITDAPAVDVIAGGLPCQPFSHAGKRGGKDDDRYLWPEMLSVIQAVRSRWVVCENVDGIVHMALDTLVLDLEASGYEVGPPLVFPAGGVGAWHQRMRLWVIAHLPDTNSRRQQDGAQRHGEPEARAAHRHPCGLHAHRCSDDLADADRITVERPAIAWKERPSWNGEPALGRVVDGLSRRLDKRLDRERVRALGNAVVPQCAEVIARAIIAAEGVLHEH